MKKIWITIILFLPLLSCNSFLDVEPETAVTFTNYFKNEAEVEAVYTSLLILERDALAPTIPSIHELMGLNCDDIYAEDIGVTGNYVLKYKELDASTFLNDALNNKISWKLFYDIIYMANVLIDNRFRFENTSDERADFWLAQAWFAKGLAYYNIARTWGDAPIVANSESEGQLGKSPANEVLAEAIRCAEKALGLPAFDNPAMINAKGKILTSKQYGSLGAAYTLLANIYAWKGGLYNDPEDWKKAEAYASLVIDKKAGNYRLEPMSTFVENVLGNTRKSDEIIFAIEINAIDRSYFNDTYEWAFMPGQWMLAFGVRDVPENYMTDSYAIEGGLKARIKSSRIQSLYSETNDLRRGEFWYNLGSENNNGNDPYAYIYKWRKTITSPNEDAKFPYLGVEGNKVIWRLADLMLLRAECRARLGMPTATEDLNTVRSRAGLGTYHGSGDIRREIFRERERELFGEGYRYYDAVRNGYYAEISPDMGALSADNIAKGAIYLPVGKGAFKDNSLMRQNIYWSWKK